MIDKRIAVKLEDVCSHITDGKHGDCQPENNSGFYFISCKDVSDGKIRYENARQITETDFIDTHKRTRLEPSDILITNSGTIGRMAIVLDNDLTRSTTFQKSVAILKPIPNKVESRFLYYQLQLDIDRLKEFAGGTAQKNLLLRDLRAFPVELPPLPVQRRIAGILSAYDELIENNQRRIKILEEIARSLYREWFVHFRFPGHDKAKMVPSLLGPIPQGWEVKEMQEVADVIDCLHSKKPEACPDGLGVLLQLNNIGDGGKLDMRELFRISANDYELWTSRIELQPGDCVVTNVGRVGAVAQIPDGVKAAPGRNMTAIRPRSGQLTPTFLIECLLSSHMASEVSKKKDLGTIMDSLNVKGIIRLHIPCPPMDAMLKFESIGRPMRKRIEVLVEQIQNLRRTRDLLLPRLLSGQHSLEHTIQ
jgi:type I restriction enzyme S subunit